MSKSNETTPNVPTLRFNEFTANWQSTTLKNVCEYRKIRRTTEKKNYVSTENIMQNFQGIERFISTEYTSGDGFNKNDILMGNIRPYLKKVCFADFDGVCNADVLVFNSKTINPKFLYYVLANDNFINYVMSSVKGSKMPRGDKNFIMQYPLSLPSEAEQLKISDFIGCLTKRIQVQNKIISKYETLIKGLSCYIIKKFNGKAYKLGTLAEIYQPQTITKTDLPDNGKYPVYGANGIIGFFDRFNHKESQIMITCRGSTCGTVNLSTPYSWITGNSMVINIDEHTSMVDKKYLYYYLKIQSFSDLISGSGQPQIVRKPLVNLNVFLPEISQQIKLRKIIDTFEKTLKNEKEMLSALQKQKAFLLQSMFI